MKVTLSRLALTTLLSKIQNIIPMKPSSPILGNLLIEAFNDELIISATDAIISMRIYIDAKVEQEGSIALPGRQFIQLIRELTAPVVEIHTQPADVAHINSGASHFKISGMLAQEFPPFPHLHNAGSFTISSKELKETLSRSLFSAARTDTQNILNTLCLESSAEETSLTTMDGKRLTKIPFSSPLSLPLNHACLIPLKTAEEILHTLDSKEETPLTIYMTSDKISVEMKSMTLVSNLFCGRYPNVKEILPQVKEDAVSLHREELMSLLRQVSLFTSESHPSARFHFSSGELSISINAPTTGEGVVKMPANYFGAPMHIAFNPLYVLDALKHSKDETVKLSVVDPYRPGLITDSTQAKFMIMPMRLEQE